ncbi:hypothetical protein KIW84_054163 [Lathyrus oleraceus]|uniref:EamA domain-containing protein n=2 Tax=Pisum sativum TaxID=3888 RepID=A0A9D5AH52_PEA|nr:hypothetical protein KIW84_054163 [Pisum sativum]
MASSSWCFSPVTATTTTTRRYSITSQTPKFLINQLPSSSSRFSTTPSSLRFRVPCSNHKTDKLTESTELDVLDCVGTGQDVECFLSEEEENGKAEKKDESSPKILCLAEGLWEGAVLISPFFFWGTAMVAMKEVLPKYGPFFVSSFRLIPAGFLLVAFAASKGRPFPSGFNAWLSISLFALIDAACFQGFLAEGLEKTSAGLGSVIIDSQPLTVAVLAALLFGESIGIIGAAGLVLGVVGLVLLELPALSFDGSDFSLWGSGELWMLLAAQSMAVGTVMVRWVSKYSDPIMATGWVRFKSHFNSILLTILCYET